MSRSLIGLRRTLALLMIGSVVTLAGACGSATPSAGGSVRADEVGEPWDLVGSWLLDAQGEDTGTVLRLDTGDLSLWRKCDVLEGSWLADRTGLFIADVFGNMHPCAESSIEVPSWLSSAVGYRATSQGPELLDRAGQVVARLRPGGRPTAPPNVAASEADPPAVTSETRRAFPRPAPLPPGLIAADAGSLAGTWAPSEDPNEGQRPEPVRLELRSDGRYVGSDGCNGVGGRWVSGADGALLATSGISTLLGCHNIDVGSWFAGARRAGFDTDGTLVLLDAAGNETGRLRPA